MKGKREGTEGQRERRRSVEVKDRKERERGRETKIRIMSVRKIQLTWHDGIFRERRTSANKSVLGQSKCRYTNPDNK